MECAGLGAGGWGGALERRLIDGSGRLGCQRCSCRAVLARYHVRCLWMEAVHQPSVYPTIRSSIHPSIVKFIFSAIQRALETDKCIHTPRDMHTLNKDRHKQIHRNSSKQIGREMETQTVMEKEGPRETEDRGEGRNRCTPSRRALM